MTSLLREIEKALDTLSPDKLEEVARDAQRATADFQRWVPNPGPQTLALESEADELFYGGQAGGGKLSDVNEIVLTPSGWRKIGALRIGDKLCAVDGSVTEVIGVFPQGVKENYRVHFHDGTSCLAGLEHNWLGWWTGEARKISNRLMGGHTAAAKYTTAEIISRMEREASNKRVMRFAIPVCQPVAFNVPGCPRRTGKNGAYVRREIDPYLLGLLIGDGSLSVAKTVSLTSADSEIADYLFETYGQDVVADERPNNVALQYRFRGKTLKWLREQLSSRNLNLAGHRAETKFIPRIYLFGTVPERWALLQGLMDTDGWAEQDGDCYYCTVSQRLAHDVAHLARSLGAVVTIRHKNPVYCHRGQRKSGQQAMTLRIKVPERAQLFRLSRKVGLAGAEPQSMAKYVERIEYSHDAESVCIQVRHPSSLYITRDFIVTHNSDLLLGTALSRHRRSLILRRLNAEVDGLIDRMVEIVGHTKGLKRNPPANWRFPNQVILFGGCQYLEDRKKYQGQPKDLIAFDELPNFLEAQYTFIIAWARTTFPNQRVRVIGAGNPPTTPEGMWVIRRWAPWLDKNHPNPALPGELRWFTTIDGQDVEVDGPGPVMIDGEPLLDGKGSPILPKSRTFIPAELDDNPDLAETGYAATLAGLPAELRAAMHGGDFSSTQSNDAFQLIPGEWIDLAFARWDESGRNTPMNVLSVDIAEGGVDNTVFQPRHGSWYDRQSVYPGKMTPDGSTTASLAIKHSRNGCEIIIDMGGGWGGSTRDHLKQFTTPTLYNGAEVEAAKGMRDRTGTLKFYNVRAAAHWSLREALDPEYGSHIAICPDPELKADLVSIHWKLTARGIQIEEKADIKARIGRSPDRSDALVMAHYAKGKTNGERIGIANLQRAATTSSKKPGWRR